MFYLIENNLGATVKDLILHWNARKSTTTYRGIPTDINPTDAWILQEIIFGLKPETIIHIGLDDIGELFYLSDLMSVLPPNGREFILFDSMHNIQEKKEKITDMIDSSVSQQRLKYVFIENDEARKRFEPEGEWDFKTRKVMVILSAMLDFDQMSRVLEYFSKYVSLNSYFIVQNAINYADVYEENSIKLNTDMNRAIDEFIASCDGKFMLDRTKEDFVLTRNPKGYIKRVK